MSPKYEGGDLVVVVTVNDGRPVIRRDTPVAWLGRIVGPSPIGEGWWMVRKIKAGNPPRTYTVPESEIRERRGAAKRRRSRKCRAAPGRCRCS